MTSPDTPTVFIVDDDDCLRGAMQRLLKTVGLYSVVCFAAGLSTAKASRHTQLPHTGCATPGMNGLEVQSKLKEAGAQIPIIFITSHGDIPMSVKAMKSGAVEFLTKPFRDQDVIDAIHEALKSDAETRQQQNERAELEERYAKLTAREREVMRLIVSGTVSAPLSWSCPVPGESPLAFLIQRLIG